MSLWWLASYVILWVMVVAIGLVLLAVLRELELQRQGSARRTREPVRAPQDDGPEIGSALPALKLTPLVGRPPFDLRDNPHARSSLLMFLTPMCEGCQLLADALNEAIDRGANRLRIIVFMRGPDQGVRAFLNVFPLNMPVIFDEGEEINRFFGVHHAPFGLLFDSEGKLIRRGAIVDANDLAALLGDGSAPEQSLVKVYPRPESSAEPTTAPTGTIRLAR